MAKTGFLYTCAGTLQEDGTHKDGRHLGPSATFNITPTTADVKDYGDNGVVETETEVTGGTVGLDLNEMLMENNAYILGHKIDEETGELLHRQEDIAPFLGIGAIGTSKRSGKNKFIGKFYPKVQFKEPNDENATKQDNTTFTHTHLDGNLFVPEDGLWKVQKEFDSLTEAKAWLNEKVGITASTDESTTGDSTEGTTTE